MWCDIDGSLIFSDAMGGGVWRLSDDGRVTEVLARRRGVGGIVPHCDGSVVVTGRDVTAVGVAGRSTVVAQLDPAWGLGRFNDIGTDQQGRIYVGGIDYDPSDPEREPVPGVLLMVDVDGSNHAVDIGVGLANGLDTSPDGSVLYFSDSWHRCIWRYDHHGDGTLSGREPLIVWMDACPDGLAVAADGSLWVALTDLGVVVVVEPDGTERMRIPVGANSDRTGGDGHRTSGPHDNADHRGTNVTSVCFGGRDLRTLFVTTQGDFVAGDKTGGVYSLDVDIAGDPVTPAAVQLNHVATS
jgi:xylono-1,5-lactonase